MAIRTPANLREWASMSPEEMKELEATDALYRQEGAARQAEEIEMVEEEEPFEEEIQVEVEGFDPEEIETYAYDIADELSQGGGDDELVALVDEYDPGEGLPNWVGDSELWEGAIDLVSEIEEQDSPIYWQLISHIYDRMGGEILSPESILSMNTGEEE